MAKYYYNGFLLPEIPQDVLADYPYCWIRNNTTSGNYDLIFGKQSWYFSGNTMYCQNSNDEKWYTLPISTSAEATGWNFSQNTTGGFGIDTSRTVLWSNHNVPNGSASSTTIYQYADEMIPERVAKPKELTYDIYTGFFPSSGAINYDGDTNTINYAIPVVKYSTYTVNMIEVGNRLRVVFTTIDPDTIKSNISATDILMNPSYSAGYTFSYLAKSDGWMIIYVSNANEMPNINISTNGAGGDGAPLYDCRYLIKANNIIYTVEDNTLVALEYNYVTSEIFRTYGFEEVSDWSILLNLVNPELLYWQDSYDELPKVSVDIQATPLPQNVITNAIDLSDPTITGIELMTVNCEGNPLFAVSFDDKQTWHAWNGTEWSLVSEEFSGMTKELLESITYDQWMLLYTGANSFYIRVSLSTLEDKLTEIYVDFAN